MYSTLQITRSIRSKLTLVWSMKWNMEENFSVKWNTEWKIFSMEWKWNGRKLPLRNMEKSSSISLYSKPWLFGKRNSRAEGGKYVPQPLIP